jgi:hypothetical protein
VFCVAVLLSSPPSVSLQQHDRVDNNNCFGAFPDWLFESFVLFLCRNYLVEKYVEMKRTKDEVLVADVHSLSAGLKAYVTSYTNTALSTARECCGGHGYAAVNRLGALRSDHDIFQTFEGESKTHMQSTETHKRADTVHASVIPGGWLTCLHFT